MYRVMISIMGRIEPWPYGPKGPFITVDVSTSSL
jgi:hypothetical protein